MMATKKYLVVFIAALALNIGLFVLMQSMVVQKRIRLADVADFDLASFIRVPESKAPPPSRRKQAPERPSEGHQAKTQSLVQATEQAGDFALTANFQFDFGGTLETPTIFLDSNLTAIVRAPVSYPQRAAMKGIEGYVEIIYTVTETGLVANPMVVAAEPEGYFEKAALQSVKKWRYQPVIQNGEAISVRAKARLIFELAEQ